jgi:CHAT domain-containing protein
MVNNGRNDKKSGNGKVAGFAPNYQKNFKYDSIGQQAQMIRTPKELLLHQNLTNLEGAKKEIQLLKNNNKGDFFIGLDASEKNFKKLNKKAYSVMHLAMHGIVDTDKPGLSSLVFTENLDSLDDNLLYAFEINSLDFSKVELVVLSACQTGFGKYELGEGVVSIGRSFMQAGVSSLVSTLWELNDNSSMEIMKLFYENLRKGLSKDQALRNAKIQYIKTHPGLSSHPFLWAGLVQYGDPSPINMSSSTYFEILLFSVLGLAAVLIAALWFYRRKKWKSQHA